ncbi:hypothetical protein JL720_7677 [Aureococcus anophagefferens]|nr:hypothetical protein JL720_7677 [Aureococcus anophagefferens]
MASRPPKHPGPLLPRLESGRQLVAPEAEPSPSKLQLPALALPADEPDRRDEAFSLFVERTSARESGRKGKRKSRSAGGKDSGRGPRPPRADDYSAYFHHHPWRGSALDLAPRLLRRLGSGGASGGHRGRDDDDDDDDDGAELEVAAHGSEWFAAVLGEPCCVLRLDAKKAVSDALRSGCGEACAVVAEIRRAADAGDAEAPLFAHWEADACRAVFRTVGGALELAARAGAEGRPHSAALAVVADELELLGDAGIAVSAAAKQRLDGEAVAPPLGLFAQSGFAWTFLPETRHKHVKVVATWLKGPGGQLDEFHQVYGSSGALYRETEASLKRAREDALRARRRRDAAKATRRADYGRGAATGGRKRQKGPQLDATCASALEELRAVTEPGDVEVERVLRNLLDALRAGKNDAVVKSRRRELLQLHARWCPRSALRTDHTPAERESQAALADWYRGAAKADQGRVRRGEDRQVRPGWAKTASRALWPARATSAPRRRPRRPSPCSSTPRAAARRALESLVGAVGRGGDDAKTAAHHLDAIVDDLRHDGAQRERTDEEKAAGAAGIRARIQYLRSRCSDPAAIDAELAADPRLLMGGPAGLSRVEALFANAQLEAAEDAEATAEAAGATAEAPAAADAAADEEEDDDDAEDNDDASSDGDASGDAVVDEAKERRRAERRAARKAEKKRLRDEAKRARRASGPRSAAAARRARR